MSASSELAAPWRRLAFILAVLALAIAGVFLFRAVRASGAGNTLTTVDSSDPYFLFGTSIAVGADGLPVMSYGVYHSYNGDLKVAHCGNATCTADNTLTTVYSVGYGGIHSAITIGTDGLPLIVHNGGPLLTHCGNADCTAGNTSATVGSSFYSNKFAIAVGADGLPIIAYDYSDFNGPLLVVHCGNQTCTSGNTLATVDATDASNLYLSIAIGTDGLPVISYISPDYNLKVAHCGTVDCTGGNTLATVDTSGSLGFYTSIAVGTDGLPVVSYDYHPTLDLPTHLRVAHCGNATCTAGNSIVTVDNSPGLISADTSIAVGTDGLPVVSYFDYTQGDLKVAHCGNAACSAGNTITTVDNTPGSGVGFGTSLAVGADGLPVISYIDITYNRLKVAHCSTPACTDTKLPTPTSTPTTTPTATPTPRPIGGISLDPQLPGSSGGDAGLLAGAIAVAMAGAIALGGAAWYTRRRRC
jgi:predicted regulator of Ras-like GTPase activity (Roadblock/LC7/MglB family)